MNLDEVTTSIGSPWQNAYTERFIGTLRWECLDHVIVLNENHLLRVVGNYLDYYHAARPHPGLARRASNRDGPGLVIGEAMARGLHHR